MQFSTLLLFISLFLPTADELTPEQIATDYFFNNIFDQDFPAYKVIEFNNLTETEGFFGVVINCDNIRNLFMELEVAPSEIPVTVNANKCSVRVKKARNNSNRLRIDVKSRKILDKRTFVYLTAYRKYRFVQHYIFYFQRRRN